ncbi:MAG: uroporphyrinogen decarboxylase family protein [Candidatus Heteroscillospira sp.]|jgi:uroporphyrinogen decarboxylase
MTSYERIMTAFRHEEADRVPITEFGVNPNVWKALGAKSLYEFQQQADYDMLVVRIKYKPIEDDGVNYTDEWGIGFKRNEEATGHATVHPIQGPQDMNKLILPPADDPYRFFYLEEAVKDWKGKKAICFSTRAMFLWAAELCGMDNLLMLMFTEPEFVEDLLDKIVENQIAVAKNAIAMGADIIDDTDDYAFNTGPLMSPDMFEDFIVPRLTRFTEAVHAAGAKIIKHSDGNMNKILGHVVSCGVDAYHSIDPTAQMDLAKVKAEYGDKITLFGNVDCGNLLTYGTPEDVRQAVRNCIKIAAPGGGYVLASSNTIPASARPENVQMMIDATREFGAYPIKL